MSKIVIAFLVVVIVAGFAIILTGVNNSPTGAFGVDASLVTNPIYLIGSLTLDSDFLAFLQEDKKLLFGPTDVCIAKNFAVRSDFFEVNGILDCPSGQEITPAGCTVGQCEIVTTLKAEILANQPTTVKERNLVLKILGVTVSDRNLEEELDCLIDIYSQQSLEVGSDTYFNKVKNCYVRAIKDLGILEQTYIDEPQAFFFVQKFQAIEVDLQHMLAIEDEKAKGIITPSPQPLGCAGLVPNVFPTECPGGPFNGNCAVACTDTTTFLCDGSPCDLTTCLAAGIDHCIPQCGVKTSQPCTTDADCTAPSTCLAGFCTGVCGSGCCSTFCKIDADCTTSGACFFPVIDGFGICTIVGGPTTCCNT